MRRTGDTTGKFSKGFSYENLAGTLAARVNGLLQSTDPRGLFPPFQVVILSQQGAVVCECEVNEDGNVRHHDPARRVRRSHFPATVFFTDQSQVTRTFQIERGASRG